MKVVPGDIDEKVHYDKTGDIVVPAGTPVAYKVWELKVRAKDGAITPMTLPRGQGGFQGILMRDYADTVGRRTLLLHSLHRTYSHRTPNRPIDQMF